VNGWPNQQFALLFVDWLTANPGVREDYLTAKRKALGAADYANAKEPWFLDAYWRARAWADSTGWRLPNLSYSESQADAQQDLTH
jgi:dephospho-CoA kinase